MTAGVSAAVALAATALVCPLVVDALRRLELLDAPSARSSHHTVTPRGGGLAVAIGAITGLMLGSPVSIQWRLALVAAAGGFGILGLIEDARGVPALVRLAFQGLLAAAVLPLLLQGLRGPVAWQVLFGAGVALWVVSFVNAFNFMDGINGVSAAQTAVAGAAWWAMGQARGIPSMAVGGLVVAGAAIGFAPFNFPRAQMFLGDVGSYFIGAWLAVLVVLALRRGLTVEAAVGPLLVYLADTAATILRRVQRGQTWHEPHRDHAYQRLVIAGWSHTRTTLLVAGLSAVCSMLGAATLLDSGAVRAAADLCILGVLACYLRSPALVGQPTTPVAAA